eukprot:427311-Rhodomonas_salina.1
MSSPASAFGPGSSQLLGGVAAGHDAGVAAGDDESVDRSSHLSNLLFGLEGVLSSLDTDRSSQRSSLLFLGEASELGLVSGGDEGELFSSPVLRFNQRSSFEDGFACGSCAPLGGPRLSKSVGDIPGPPLGCCSPSPRLFAANNDIA